MAPSWRAFVASVHAVFVSVSLLPALIVVVTRVLVFVLVFISLIALVRHQGRSVQGQHNGYREYCDKALAHVSLHCFSCNFSAADNA
jgi:hypothetical protein